MDSPKSHPNLKILGIGIAIFFIFFSFLIGFYFGSVQGGTINTVPGTWLKTISNGGTSRFDSQLFNQVTKAIRSRYVNQPVAEQELFYGSLKGLVASLGDPYSIFLDPQETKEFNKELQGSFEGIGAEIGIKNNQLTIIAPLLDSPAIKAGLKAGDKIYKIDGKETVSMSLDEAITLIRGPENSSVTLTILSLGETNVRDVSVKRQVITMKSVTWKKLDGNIAEITLSHFTSDTVSEFKNVAQEIILANPQGIILDLRDNPGGFLDASIDIAGEFVGNKVIVIEEMGTKQESHSATGSGSLLNFKMVVLVNNGSASASEIVAGALQDYGRATLVGEQTYGKGSVQDFEEFDDGSSLKLTVAKWLTPKGRSINENGISPDIQVKLTDDDYNNNRDPQLDKAMELLKS